jgi:hypothetical protein
MNKELLQYISDINDFAGENWDQFLDNMVDNLGFTESQIDRMNGKLGEYLEDNL